MKKLYLHPTKLQTAETVNLPRSAYQNFTKYSNNAHATLVKNNA